MQSGKGEASVIFYGMDQSQRCLSKFLQEEGNVHTTFFFFFISVLRKAAFLLLVIMEYNNE